MKGLVIYDSLYGNTEKIAQMIGSVLRSLGEITVQRVGEVRLEQLAGIDLLVVGSPTHQFRPTKEMKNFLDSIPKGGLNGIKVAGFDTRFTWQEIEKTPPLPFFVKIYGYAAKRIAKQLVRKGGELVVEAQGFFVQAMQGPLCDGEEERAAAWAGKLFA